MERMITVQTNEIYIRFEALLHPNITLLCYNCKLDLCELQNNSD